MNRRNFLTRSLAAAASAALAPAAGPPAAVLFREYSPAGLAMLAQRDRIADALNAVVAAGGDPASAEYAAGLAQMRELERQIIAMEN